MDLRKLQRVIVDALDDIKAQDIRVFNTTGQTDLFDRVIVASATSNRQTRALASHVRDKVKEAGGQVISVEGEDSGEWVLVDLGDAVVHIMQPAIRAYYRLEELWGEKPVNLKIGPERVTAVRKAEKASRVEKTPAAAKAPTAAKTPAAAKAPTAAKAPAAAKTSTAAKAAKPRAKPVASKSPDAPAAARPRKPAASKTAATPGASKSGAKRSASPSSGKRRSAA